MGNDEVKRQREYLTALPGLTGKSLTALAKEIAVSPSTLLRPLAKGTTVKLRPGTIYKLAHHTGIAFPPGGPVLTQARLRAAAGELYGEVALVDLVDHALRAVLAQLAGDQAFIAIQVQSRALDLAGIVPPDLVLATIDTTPKPGDLVLAELRDSGDLLLRQFRRAGATEILVTRSTDAELEHAVIPLDGERVRLRGVLLPHRLRAA